MMNSTVHVPNMNTIPLDSTITVEDSEPEMIDLDSSPDNEITCLDNSAICNSEKTEYLTTDDVDAINEMTTHSSSDMQSNDETLRPAFKVMFRDEKTARQYRRQIREFLHTLVQSDPSQKEDVNESSLILEIWDNRNNSKDQESFMESNSEPNDTMQSDDTCDLLFTIDKQPNVKNNLDIPKYGQKYKGTFEESNSETSKDLAPKLNCFNCNGNHNMRECPLPKNQANINKNRKEFVAKYTGVRYHMSEDQRFSHMIPGQLSPKLRKALGLKDNQLPRHIYRMRMFGYPPGWLEEARLQHSGISLFNSDGVAEADPNQEEGEIITEIDKDQYDMKKIYDFPGFNVLPAPNMIDDSHKQCRIPQMQPMHSKEIMLSYLKGKKADDGYKRKKLVLPPPVMNIPSTLGDMEIDDLEEGAVDNVSVNGHFIPPLPKELVETLPAPLPPPPPPPPLPPPAATAATSSSSEAFQSTTEDSDSQLRELSPVDSTYTSLTINSPSLSDLEYVKKELLRELEHANSQSNSGFTSLKTDSNATFVSDNSFSDTVTTSHCTSRESLNTSQDSVKNCLDESFNSDLNVSPSHIATTSTPAQKSSHQSSIKSVHLGTPLLSSASPYNKLPSSEKFSKNISNLINFENLPDSTGKYEQMTGVLQKVRNTMARLNQET
ncbi:zinc finger CCHC domain-containing protein 8 homolog [Linepithema humile]|uniref:zinc finger CCHC domain-containing protein 8 homolog n=1 Tax=Linepithema humile TaxID=83485 RepID=UPI00351E7F47